MGSYVNSNSTTNYSNTPVTLSDLTNPVVLTGSSGSQIGGSGNVGGSLTTSINGSTLNTLDGGAISKAFEFGQNAITAIAALTKQTNEAVSSNNAAALGFTERANSAAQTLVDKKENATSNTETNLIKTLVIFAAIGIGYFAWKASK